MHPTIAELFKSAAEKMRADFEEIKRGSPHAGERGEEAEEIVRRFLNEHLPKRFAAAAGHMIDNANQLSHQADVLVYDQISSPVYRTGKGLILPSENVAAIIEVKSRLNKQELLDAAGKIAKAKSLMRPDLGTIDQPVTFSSLVTTSLLGVVFGFEAETRLETLAENLKDFHAGVDSSHWTDIIVSLDEGLIGLYVQFPFQPTKMAGMFMPPASREFKVPPLYVHLLANRQGSFTLNRFFVALTAHLIFFRRRTAIPIEQMMAGAPKEGMTIQGYWCTTERRFVPVPADQEVGKHEGLVEAVRIHKMDGQPVGQVGWMRWADGHVVVFQGPGRPPAELIEPYTRPYGAEMIFQGIPDRNDLWISELLPGLPTHFVGVSLDLPRRTGYKFSAELIKTTPVKP